MRLPDYCQSPRILTRFLIAARHHTYTRAIAAAILVPLLYVQFPDHFIPYIVALILFTSSPRQVVALCCATFFWTILKSCHFSWLYNMGERHAAACCLLILAAVLLSKLNCPPPHSNSQNADLPLMASPWKIQMLAAIALLLLLSAAFQPFSIVNACWAFIIMLHVGVFSRPKGFMPILSIVHIAAMLLIILAASIILTESASRVILPARPISVGYFMFDPVTLHTLKPGGYGRMQLRDNSDRPLAIDVHISEQGLRNEMLQAKKIDEVRILTLGDSYTMGQGLADQDTFQKKLEQLLNQHGAPVKTTVINGGVAAFAPWQEHLFLLERGFPLEPDLVILQLFPANDIAGSLYQANKRLRALDPDWERSYASFIKQKELPQYLERWFQKHSNLYRLLLLSTNASDWIIRTITSCRLYRRPAQIPPTSIAPRPPYQEPCLVQWYPELEEAWNRYAASIRAIRDDCKKRNVDVIAFVHGYIHEAWNSYDERCWETLRTMHPKTPYEANKDIRLTQELLAELHIPQVDVMSALSSHPIPEDLYYVHDGHFSPEGAQLIAQCLFDFMSKTIFSENSGANHK